MAPPAPDATAAPTGLSGRDRLARRLPALVASGATLLGGMYWALYWLQVTDHAPGVWLTPADLWKTYAASVALVHGHLGSIYSTQTGLVAFPGVVVLLAPVAALGSALGLTVGGTTAFSAPTAWVLLGPVMLGLSAVALFAIDAVADRLGVPTGRRVVLGLVGALALSNVTVRWGHPEDALSVGLVLYGALAATDRRFARACWLIGLAIAIQPLALLVAPMVLVTAYPPGGDGRRRGPAALATAVALGLPSLVVLAGPLIAGFHATWYALTNQPNHPARDHPTPWTSLSPSLGGGAVAGGPGRIISLVLTTVGGVVVGRRRPSLAGLVWWCALAFVARCAFESVLDSFYVWPVLGLGLALSARRGPLALGLCSGLALADTWFSKVQLHGVWPWWLTMMAGLVAVLGVSWPAGDWWSPLVAPAGRGAGEDLGADGRSDPAGSSMMEAVGPPP